MSKVFFTRASDKDTCITVTLKRLLEAGVVKNSKDLYLKGSTVNLTLKDKYGNKKKVVFMVNREGEYATLRSITSVDGLTGLPKVSRPSTYEVR